MLCWKENLGIEPFVRNCLCRDCVERGSSTRSRTHKCFVCDGDFKQWSTFSTHQCPVRCDKMVSQLAFHNNLPCSEKCRCKNCYKRRSVGSRVEQQRHACNLCNRTFSQSREWRTHIRLGVRSFLNSKQIPQTSHGHTAAVSLRKLQ